LTFNCTPSSVTAGGTITCSCSGSDNSSGVESTSYTINPSTASVGTFNTTCNVTDYAGNSNSTNVTYTVTSAGEGGEGGEGGGGGGGTTLPNVTTNVTEIREWTTITPDNVTIMRGFDLGTGIKEIHIEVNKTAQNVTLTVTKYSGKPAEVIKERPGKVYKYLKIETENLGDKLEKATLKFRVNKTWIINNSLERDDMVMAKYNGQVEEWYDLETTYTESDDVYEHYDTELDSFSYFAIADKLLVKEEIKKERKVIDISGIISFIQSSIKNLIVKIKSLIVKKNLIWFGIIAGVILILIVLTARRIVKSKQHPPSRRVFKKLTERRTKKAAKRSKPAKQKTSRRKGKRVGAIVKSITKYNK
jgi:PGF-pre-PGF domain-containing protein